jgi:hypothetical protein
MFGIKREHIHIHLRTFIGCFGMYVLWIVLHYVSSHMYIYLCVPATALGFIVAPFFVTLPHCQALRWTIYNGGNSIVAMWVILGIWIMHFLKAITV